jgi:hypothetical protein
LRGWGAHLVLEVCVGPRGEEEFHDAGVTVARGPHERRVPTLKERTERERGRHHEGGGQQQQKHIHTHIRIGREEREEETEARWGKVRFTWGVKEHMWVPNVQNVQTNKRMSVRYVPKYKRATQAQVIVAPEAK